MQRKGNDGGSVMEPQSLETIASYCDTLLNHATIEDWPGARNGLQVQNEGKIFRIIAAVDAGLPVLEAAVADKSSLLLVHHGLFWSPIIPLTGANYRKMRLCFDNDLAVYSSHLPLDGHPVLGNTAGLARAMELVDGEPWFDEKGTPIGLRFAVDLDRQEIAGRFAAATGKPPHLVPSGPERVRSLGIVTGGAGNEAARAAALGVDTFLTGEGAHWTYALGFDLGINIMYGGHYATETFGVKALASHLSERFGLPWSFVDMPSGL